MSTSEFEAILLRQTFDGGCKIESVTNEKDVKLATTVVDTMMRIDLSELLPPGHEMTFKIKWNYKINNARLLNGRTGSEFFEKDGNYIYEMAQWFPRLAAFTDVTGWQHKQYLGQGEFTLEFGDYIVRITTPSDHIVGSTGVLQNPNEVLSSAQLERLSTAKAAGTPVFIVTPEEAKENEKIKSDKTKTWVFHAENVRDFAFASSRKFIWDAQGHNVNGNSVMAMSYYPNEAEPLWSKYSTHAIIHTLNVYSRYTFDYPYPIAISVNGPIGGMEYPMICFNGPRPKEDGTYSSGTKYGLISVVIHEVGHNYFPMIVNSDERQWSWMDEGLNTFLQYLAEQEWQDEYPSQRGEPEFIVPYMQSNNQVPIMTNSESIMQFGPNAYSKPATALNILRETILGRELFDFSFKEYARRWKFKRPMPADFFRTMEDASSVDLDWFWRGWFYTTDHCDIAIEKIEQFQVDKNSPDEKAVLTKTKKAERRQSLSKQRDKPLVKRADQYPELKDFYNTYDPSEVTDEQRQAFEKFKKGLSENEKKLLENTDRYYRVSFKNVGGLIMPIILMVTFEDGSTREIRIAAETWRVDSTHCDTLIVSDKPLKSLELDPYRETADIDRNNNHFPPIVEATKFQLFKMRRNAEDNPMQAAKAAEAKKAALPKETADKLTDKSKADVTKDLEETNAVTNSAATASPDKNQKAESNPVDEPKKKKNKKKSNKANKKD